MVRLNDRPCVLDLRSMRVEVKACNDNGSEWWEWWDIEFPLYRPCQDFGVIFVKVMHDGVMEFGLYFKTNLTELWDADAFVESLVNTQLEKENTYYKLRDIADYTFK